MADTSSQAGITDWGGFLGAGAGALTNYLGNQSATNSLTGAEQNAIGTQQGLQGQLAGIYGSQRGLGTGADAALGAQLGLGGTPDYSAFLNSPGFQSSLALGNQGIERAASANGSLYTPNMLNQLGQYDTTYASQNYNNYISQLMQSAGLGAQGNSGLAQGYSQSANNVSQLQQNQGNAKAGGTANATGIASNLLGKVPWNQVGNWFNGNGSTGTPVGTSGDGSGGFGGDWSGMGDYNSLLSQYGGSSSDPSVTDTSGGTTTYWGDSSNPS